MRYVLLIALISCSSLAFAGKYQAIRTGEVSYEASTSASDIQKAVKRALIQRGWKVRESTDTFIDGRLRLRQHRADVKITWKDGTILISYVDSDKLGYRVKKGKKLIHRNYNKWIANLERDISVFLTE